MGGGPFGDRATMRIPKTIIRPPEIPSKMDIIPIHASDRGSFKSCRRKWNWSSPMRNNLVPRVADGSIAMPLWFGSGIHWSLKHMYDPSLSRDPVEVFETWYSIQINGGIITPEWLEVTYDRKPIPFAFDPETKKPETYKIRGLADMLPDPALEIFEEHRELGINMLKFYKEYAEAHDTFSVIMAEHTFSIPILNPDGSTLTWEDPRDGVEKEVHLRGTQDGIIQSDETGQFGILEHKSSARMDEDYFAKLEKDEQCTTYMYAAEREAELYDLEYGKIEYVLYNVLRKNYPKPPTEVRGGVFSVNRQTECTSPELLQEFIDERGIQVIVDSDPKLQAYVDYVKDQGTEQFIRRDYVRRNRAEKISCGQRVYMEALDMLDSPRIYPNPTGNYSCIRCPFRGPCIAADDGSDWQMMLGDMFEENWTR